MASRSTNTMAEFLQRMLGDISQAKTLPDADLEFLVSLETGILQKLRAPIDALQGQAQGQMGGGGPQQAPGGGMPGADVMAQSMPAGMGQQQAGIPSLRQEPNIPTSISPDEMTRMLGGAK